MNDSQSLDTSRPSTLVARNIALVTTRRELTTGFVEQLQEELSRKKAQHAITMYKFFAEQKMRDAIGPHAELVPPAGASGPLLNPGSTLMDDPTEVLEQAQPGEEGSGPPEDGNSDPTGDASAASSSIEGTVKEPTPSREDGTEASGRAAWP